MSKKLIAVASAAALALTGLVALPNIATAAPGPFSVSVVQSETLSRVNANGSTGDLELVVLVPSTNVVRLQAGNTNAYEDTTSNTLLRFNVKTPLAGAKVTTNTSSDSTKFVTQAQVTAGSLTAASGAREVSVDSNTDGNVTLYAYTTTTADTTVTISSGNSSTTLFIKGLSPVGNGYKINFTGPTDVALGGLIKFSGTVVDMFGNLLTLTAADIATSQLGGSLTAGDIAESKFDVNATTKVTSFEITGSTTASTQAISIALVAPAAEVTALGARVASQFFSVNATDLTAVVTSLQAQVAALQATMAGMRTKALSVTKKKYNSLARKWNAQNRTARVALKK